MAIRQVIDDAAFPPFNTRSEAPILPAHIAGQTGRASVG